MIEKWELDIIKKEKENQLKNIQEDNKIIIETKKNLINEINLIKNDFEKKKFELKKLNIFENYNNEKYIEENTFFEFLNSIENKENEIKIEIDSLNEQISSIKTEKNLYNQKNSKIKFKI